MVKNTITVNSLDGKDFVIKFDSQLDNCWSITLPDYWKFTVWTVQEPFDTVEDLIEARMIVWHTGSLERIMMFLADHIVKCEV